MRNIFFTLILLFSVTYTSMAINGRVADETNTPMEGVKVYWSGSTVFVETDKNGMFSIDTTAATRKLMFYATTFSLDSVIIDANTQDYSITLHKLITLHEVAVESRTPGTFKSRIAILETENITASELKKAACCNLSESFETNASVDVTYSDAATGAKQIKLLGLSGKYVQMITENVPSIRGLASSYGLNYTPGPWMEGIQVSKGTASVINGYEAITGQINVEYKKPQKYDGVNFNLFVDQFGRVEANATTSIKLSEHLATGLLIHASKEFIKLDENKDGFMDLPASSQINIANRWYFHKDNYTSQLFLRGLSELREGGQINGDYKIKVETNRYEFFFKNGLIIDPATETSLGIITSGSLHDQGSNFGARTYDGEQQDGYANVIFQTGFDHNNKLSTGASFNIDNYVEVLYGEHSLKMEYWPGVFAEYSFKFAEHFSGLIGLREDYNSYYDAFLTTPRLHLKYTLTDNLHLRATIGKGYRSSNVLAENNYLLASNRILNIPFDQKTGLKMEEAWNYGASIHSIVNLWEKDLNLTAEWYYTNFINQVVVDMDSDPHAVSFYNLNGKSYSSTAQIEANIELFKGVTITAAHRISDVKTTIGGVLREKPLTSRYRSLVTLSYLTSNKYWQFDFTTQFNGGGRMPDPDVNNPLWSKGFNPYQILNAQMSRNFKNWAVYLGMENITNYLQPTPVIDAGNPNSVNFDATMIWGPLMGRKVYAGLRWNINKD
jgi:outer membrane receptor for ferrienterochelin and colicins